MADAATVCATAVLQRWCLQETSAFHNDKLCEKKNKNEKEDRKSFRVACYLGLGLHEYQYIRCPA